MRHTSSRHAPPNSHHRERGDAVGTRVNAATRVVVATTTSVALSFTLGGLILSGPASAVAPYVATGAVNVRSGPGTSYPILGVLSVGDAVSGASASDGWVRVTYDGATGYVSDGYLRASATTPSGSTAPMVTTADLNLRSGPSLDAAIVKVLAKGTTVAPTGATSDRFVEVLVDGAKNWVSGNYLTPAAVAAPLPAVAYKARTTAVLAMRKSPQIDATVVGDLKTGTEVSLTGTHSGSYSQIVRQDGVLWVLTGYLTSISPGPTLPKATGRRYVGVDEVNVRATSASNGKVIRPVAQGTVLLITGKTANSRTQVIVEGGLGWAYTPYLSKTKPTVSAPPTTDPGGSLGSASLDRTNANVKAIVRLIRVEFPTIKTMYGWRASSDYSSDHPSGRALDIMIPKYSTSTGKALGDKIALHLQQNHKKLRVHYLIWRQRDWNVERNLDFTKGWRKMADRGGSTANHYDHVHVSVYDN